MTGTRFIFTCKDPSLDFKAAEVFLTASTGIEIIHHSGTDASFLAKAEPSIADAFKAANPNWLVCPEVKYKLPRTRFSTKPPKAE